MAEFKLDGRMTVKGLKENVSIYDSIYKKL